MSPAQLGAQNPAGAPGASPVIAVPKWAPILEVPVGYFREIIQGVCAVREALTSEEATLW